MITAQEICRATPFHGQWTLVGRFVVIEAGALRQLDHAHIDRFIGIRRRWQDRFRKVNPGGSWHLGQNEDITDKSVGILHELCDMLQKETRGYKLMICSDWIYVYSNDRDLLDDFGRVARCKMQDLKQVKLQGSPDSVNLKTASHAWRSFFCGCRVEKKTIESMVAFLDNQPDVRLSPALKHCIKHGWSQFERWYFVDHNDRTLVTMLSLIGPGLIRKTVPIVASDK
jgi:hypothetical protein